MKKVLLTLACIILAITCFTQPVYKQTRIPLNNVNGVPFKKEGDFIVDGFEVDSLGSYYFLGGSKAKLVVFLGTKQTYQKVYTEFYPAQLYLLDNRLYVFDGYLKNKLFEIDPSNGSILHEYNHNIDVKFNSYQFINSKLIVEINDEHDIHNLSFKYLEYDLTGKYLRVVNNFYDIPDLIYPYKYGQIDSPQFLGKWDNGFLFWYYNPDKHIYEFWLTNEGGSIIARVNINSKLFGAPFYGNPDEHRKLRNGSIFVLGGEGMNALITELPLKTLFSANN